jgi:hypothetical protein
MVQNDLQNAKQHALLKKHGFDVSVAIESWGLNNNEKSIRCWP